MPAPQELSDSQIKEKIWEIALVLQSMNVFLESTNHLSDRQLYERLWNDSFRQEHVLLPENSDYACHLDLVTSGSEEYTDAYLRYYADEDERRRWAEDFPNLVIPPHEEFPFDRDDHLPQREYPW